MNHRCVYSHRAIALHSYSISLPDKFSISRDSRSQSRRQLRQHQQALHLATSADFIHWQPVEDTAS
jgi:hypothetical protein